ncbi:type II secretion system protein N [Coralloluteibacterium thermophilus]|uniref:Type II secretion system protein N n=1 Tax=Coralloluteibacterium thermophilum TaxID=2707049 RepID=A0ABV9NPM5_9GAMM
MPLPRSDVPPAAHAVAEGPRAVVERLRGRWPAVLEGLVVALLAVQAARLAWLLAVPGGPVGSAAPAALAATAPAHGVRDPFAPAAGTAVAAQAPTGLTLHGVRVAAGGGSAILADADGRQSAYAVGDTVAPGLVLARVAADHVVLRGGGGERRLDLPATAALPLPVPAALPTGTPAVAASRAGVDPQRLLAETGLRARSEGGRIDGYELIPRGDGGLLRAAGLQPGDVLLAVNGNTLDPERLAELEQELAGRGAATLTIRRGDATHTITLDPDTP